MLASSSAIDTSLNGVRELMSDSAPKLDFQSPRSTPSSSHRSDTVQPSRDRDSSQHMESSLEHSLDMSQVIFLHEIKIFLS